LLVTKQPVSLSALPDIVLREILGYLLLTQNVEVTVSASDGDSHRAYRFETSILRTCKTMYTHGLAVLKLNRFILASSTQTSIFLKNSQDHDIVLWTRRFSHFKHYALRLHIVSQKLGKNKEKLIFFMLCLADLEDFLCMLRQLTYTMYNPRWKIQLQLEAGDEGAEQLSIRYQESLLSPFEKLKGVGQHCKVKGNVDAALAERVEKSMTPTVFWTRARCRDYFDIIAQKLAMARNASQKKHLQIAHIVYDDILREVGARAMIGWIYFQFIACGDSGEEVFRSNFFDKLILEQCQQGLVLSKLWLAEQWTNKSEVYMFCEGVLPYVYGRPAEKVAGTGNEWRVSAFGLHLRAAAHVGMGQYEKARQSVLDALKLEPSALYRNALRMCEEFQMTPSISQTSKFKKYMTLVPIASLARPRQAQQVSVIAAADQERHALRTHGYTGPLHMESIVPKEGYSFDKGQEIPIPFDAVRFDEQTAPSQAHYASCIKKGVRPPDVHIGPGCQTGPRGVMAAFDALRLRQVLHPMSESAPGTRPGPRDRTLHMGDLLNVYQVSMEELEREYPEVRRDFAGLPFHFTGS